MNANEISPKADARLNRIKIVSRIAKFTVLAISSVFLGRLIFFQAVNSFPSFHELMNILAAVSVRVPVHISTVYILDDLFIRPAIVVVLSIWYLKLVGLFRFYEQGLIFAGKTIHRLKILGLLCVAGWILNCISHYFSVLEYRLIPQQLSPQSLHRPVVIAHFIDFRGIGFFSFDFGTGIDFGLLLAGIVIVLVAWIMDEGRKIQEEQELTV